MKGKKMLRGSLLVVLLIAGWFLLNQYFSYPIALNMVTLPEYIREFSNRGNSVERTSQVDIHSGVTIGDIEYYLVDLDGDFGYVRLERGLFGRYKILNLGRGTGAFRKGVVEVDGEKYLLFAGRDMGHVIDRIEVVIDHVTYTLEVPQNYPFFVHTKLEDGATAQGMFGLGDVTFYDKNGVDITDQYNLSGGGFQ